MLLATDELIRMFITVSLVSICVISLSVQISSSRSAPKAVVAGTTLQVKVVGLAEECIKAALKCAIDFNYRVEIIDLKQQLVVLSDRVGLVSWGFFYYVKITESNDGVSSIQLRSIPRLGHPILRNLKLEHCFSAIRAEIILAGLQEVEES